MATPSPFQLALPVSSLVPARACCGDLPGCIEGHHVFMDRCGNALEFMACADCGQCFAS